MNLGKIAYEAYCKVLGEHAQFHLLPANHQAAWIAGAESAVTASKSAEARTLDLFEPTAAKRGPKRVAGYKELMVFYTECFKTKFLKNPVFTPRNGKSAKEMLLSMSLEDATTCIKAAFEDKYFLEHGCNISTALANANRYLTKGQPVAIVLKSTTSQSKPEYR